MSERSEERKPIETGNAANVENEDNTVGRKHPESRPREIGGPAGPEPTRYGDWEVNGRCSDF